jgi:hypothetical protein
VVLADYHASKPHVLDYSKFPNDEQQKKFTLAYVRAVITLKKHKEEQVGTHMLPHSLTDPCNIFLSVVLAVSLVLSCEQCWTESLCILWRTTKHHIKMHFGGLLLLF